nr:replication protein A 70 kDa DNA-binding subunit B [Tanacetum cinerariifolium]
MEHTLTQLCDIDPMLDDIKESKEKNRQWIIESAIVFKKDIQVIDLTNDEVISSLVFHPYFSLQIPDIKSIKVDPMLYNIKVLARCISIWKAHPSGKPNNICSLDIVFQDHQLLLDEGSCYRIGNFDVGNNSGNFPLLTYKYKMNLYKNIEAKIISGGKVWTIVVIPRLNISPSDIFSLTGDNIR